MNKDYLQDALKTFNLNTPNWYGWRTHDNNENKISSNERMSYENIIVIENSAIKPTKQQVELKIQELKDLEDNKLANKQSALNKLKALGLNDAEINSILGK
jgi:hypothetical protein